MKKIIAAVAFVFTIALAEAQSDSTRTKYEYYPEANVYYNDVSHNYWYYDSTSSQWQSKAQLPSSYSVDAKSRKNSFYYNGGDVWKENAKHKQLYGKKGKGSQPK